MTEEDLDLYHKWRNDLEVMQFTSPSLDVYQKETTRNFVNQVILGNDTAKSYIMVEKDTEVSMGIVSLINIDYKNRNAECIIDIGEKEYWGNGYGTEGLKILLDFAFYEMNLHRVMLKVFSFNERAVKLYDKIGFEKEGVSRECLFRNGEWHDIVHMGILQEEYLLLKR